MTDLQNVNFKPENTLPTAKTEISEEAKFAASVKATLAKADALLKGKINTADAANQDGDTLHISGSNKQKTTVTQRIYNAFQIGIDQAKNLISSVDGMKPYAQGSGWETFPERGITEGQKSNDSAAVKNVQWGKGLNEDYTPHSSEEGVKGEQTFIKGNKDGGIDRKESELAIQQLEWDKGLAQKGSAKSDYTPGQQINAANNAENLLHSIHDKQGNIRPEFDINNNKVFDVKDAETLANLVDETGNGKVVLSADDLDRATNDYIMNGVTYKEPAASKSELSEYKGDFTGQQVAQYFNFAANTPKGQENDVTTHNLTLDEAKTTDKKLQQIAQMKTSKPEQFKAELAKTGISEKNFDSVVEFSRQMLVNDAKLHNALMQQFRGEVEGAVTTADMNYASNTKEPEADPKESSDFFYLNNNEIKHIVKNYGK
ncbi:MAG: hypothetical protein AB1782_17340 [Cyanobacteriota bacterium]